MARRSEADKAYVIRELCSDPVRRLGVRADGTFALSHAGRSPKLSADVVARLAADGLIVEIETGRFAASEAARAWLRRHLSPDEPFRMQHGEIVAGHAADLDANVLVNLDEVLSRRWRGGSARMESRGSHPIS